MRIVITEFMDPRAVAQLEARHEVLYAPDLVDNPAQLLTEARTADAIIVRNRTQVRGDLLDQLTQCRCVGRLGVGLDNIDVEGCVDRNISVFPATGANSLSVAEYVISAMMTLLRPVFSATTQMTQGKWPRAALSDGGEVGGKRLGVIGYGAIGQTSARLARGLGMTVIAFDAMLPPDAPIFARTGVQAADLDTLLKTADVITLHVPLVASTRGLIGADQLARMAIERGTDGFADVLLRFGDEVIRDGDIDRKKLAEIVFSDEGSRKDLEAIIHPRVQALFAQAVADLDIDDILIYEIPLLVETGASEKFDYVITVESDIELRKARLLKKGLYISQIEKRMASQASEEARTAVADAVIRNDGDEDSLLRQVENLWESVLLPQSLG